MVKKTTNFSASNLIHNDLWIIVAKYNILNQFFVFCFFIMYKSNLC